MQCQHLNYYTSKIQLHMYFGVITLLPFMLLSFQKIMAAIKVGFESGFAGNGHNLELIIPIFLMVGPLIALCITTFRYLRVRMARYALGLLTCGICFGTLYVCDRLFGYVPSLFLASFIPYYYVRWVGRGMLNREILLSQSQVDKLNSND